MEGLFTPFDKQLCGWHLTSSMLIGVAPHCGGLCPQAKRCEEEAARTSKHVKEVEEWCSGELDALKADSAERLAKEEQQVVQW